MSPDLPKPRIYYGWYVVATTVFIAFVGVGARQGFGVFVVPMSEDFGWSRSSISFAASLGFLLNGLIQPSLGFVDSSNHSSAASSTASAGASSSPWG